MTDHISEPPEHLARLVGSWTTEATHVLMPGVVVHGAAEFEWLEGERFMIHRARNEHPDFPDSISIIGDTDGLRMHYFDSRGVHRIYETRVTENAWEMSRDAPQFSQRFEGKFENGGGTIVGLWKLSEDDATFKDDLHITYRRVGS
jgi:hypothetical protein